MFCLNGLSFIVNLHGQRMHLMILITSLPPILRSDERSLVEHYSSKQSPYSSTLTYLSSGDVLVHCDLCLSQLKYEGRKSLNQGDCHSRHHAHCHEFLQLLWLFRVNISYLYSLVLFQFRQWVNHPLSPALSLLNAFIRWDCKVVGANPWI